MQAGRELDALVAEKVMGECRHDWKVSGPNVWNYRCTKCGMRDSNFSGSGLYKVGKDREYSTSIADAWKVVDKMHKDKFLFDISLSVGAGYTVRFFNRDKEIFHTGSYIEIAPLAICLAALDAVGVEVNA